MDKTDQLIIEVLEIRNKKNSAAINQKYEDAAILRDSEKKVLDKINQEFGVDYSNYFFIEKSINEYLYKKYGLNLDNYRKNVGTLSSDYTSLIREIKIRNIID